MLSGLIDYRLAIQIISKMSKRRAIQERTISYQINQSIRNLEVSYNVEFFQSSPTMLIVDEKHDENHQAVETHLFKLDCEVKCRQRKPN